VRVVRPIGTRVVRPIGTRVKQKATKIRPARATNAVRRARAVLAARRALGVRYVWGGESLRGMDCSGLTRWSYRQAGLTIPRTASQQFRYGRAVATSSMTSGDLVFFRVGRRISHVGMYVGGGRMIHSPRPGKRVSNVAFGGYWRRRFAGARRFL
jgi:cell wall-associated NlpC family hydrolase